MQINTFRAEQIGLKIGPKPVLDGVHFSAERGKIHALVGANGAGKSSLLKILSADLAPSSGKVFFDAVPISQFSQQQLALWRAVLPQLTAMPFPLLVDEVVAMGRYPHRQASAVENQQKINAALELLRVTHLRRRAYPSLSGGEQQRVQLARVLAQETPIILLDEPVSALDLAHQHQLMHILKQKAAAGALIVIILHDLNLALRYADTASVLQNGKMLASGKVDEVINADILRQAFEVEAHLQYQPLLGCMQLQVLAGNTHQ